jgi:hypothetical protein
MGVMMSLVAPGCHRHPRADEDDVNEEPRPCVTPN